MPMIDATAAFAAIKEGPPAARRAVAALWATHAHPLEFDAGAPIVRAGTRPSQAFFLSQGLVRCFYSYPNGRYSNKAFVQSGEFFGSLESALTGHPCRYDIQAMQPSSVLALDLAVLERLAKAHPEVDHVQRLEVRRAFLRSEEREAVLLTLNAEDRYRWLRERYRTWLDGIPHYHLAAFLGLTAVSFSLARKKVENEHGGA